MLLQNFIQARTWMCLGLLLIGSSCMRKKQPLKLSEAPLNHVAVLVDDKLWNGVLGDSIRNMLAQPAEGLPQEEPQFILDQFPISSYEPREINLRNVWVIKKNSPAQYVSATEKRQGEKNIFTLTGPDVATMMDTLKSHTREAIFRMRETEMHACQQKLLRNHTPSSRMARKFKVGCYIPQGLEMALSRRKFLWFKRDIIGGSVSLVVYQVPMYAVHGRKPLKALIRMRDSVCRKYIHGTRKGSRMVTDAAYTPYLNQLTVDGRRAYQLRGTWEMKNDYMDGPFLMYAIRDKARLRYIVCEGFVYAPSKEKRDLMFELEAAMRTLRFITPKKIIHAIYSVVMSFL